MMDHEEIHRMGVVEEMSLDKLVLQIHHTNYIFDISFFVEENITPDLSH